MEINKAFEEYIRWRRASGLVTQTLDLDRSASRHFNMFLRKVGKNQVEDITYDLLREFQEDFAFKYTPEGKFYSRASRNGIHQKVRCFLRWLYDADYHVRDLSGAIEKVRKPRKLPRNILGEKDIEALMEIPDMSHPLGFRDRVALEILYGTGIRNAELRKLKVSHVELEEGTLFIEQGKGQKDRVVPLGKGLCQLLKVYLNQIRPRLLYNGEENEYLITAAYTCRPLSASSMDKITRVCSIKMNKRITPHILRHACATHMVQHGAPIKCVQDLLGHASVESTQIYTHLTIKDLKKAHAKYHPREKMNIGPE